MGSGCHVSWEGSSFSNSGLMVLDGAKVEIRDSHFEKPESHIRLESQRTETTFTGMHRLHVFCCGIGSSVRMHSCEMVSSDYLVAIQDGAELHASDCSISKASRTGVLVKGEGTSVTLSKCNVAECGQMAVHIGEGAQGQLGGCTISESLVGLDVRNAGSHAALNSCKFIENEEGGVFVIEHASVDAVGCESRCTGDDEHVRPPAYGWDVRHGAELCMEDCVSTGDEYGCSVSNEAKLVAENVKFIRTRNTGVRVCNQGHAVLRDCEMVHCKVKAGSVRLEGSMLEVEKCTVLGGQVAFKADACGVAAVRACDIRDNEVCTFQSSQFGKFNISDSSIVNDVDTLHCSEEEAGLFTLDNVSINGVRQSRTWP
jgi:hypothetical protein